MNARLLMAIIVGFLGWSSLRAQASSDELVVHEWGTFTSIAGADSQTVEWTPYRGGATAICLRRQAQRKRNGPHDRLQ
mgnify:CR=1 FL=1